MKQICDFCGGYISDTDQTCPNCGATNNQYKRTGDGVPRTIEEMKAWYKAHNLPPEETTRFFIGKDYKQPKAFGIYQDGDRFIVYKNKADGTRAIRYDGGDEAYAVNEIYLKLKEEIAERKAAIQRVNCGSKPRRTHRTKKNSFSITTIYILIALICVLVAIFSKDKGYYSYNDRTYYYLDNWYLYDTGSDTWIPTTVDSELNDNAKDYFQSSGYSSSYDVSDFEDTSYYSDWQSSNDSNDWDSGSSWDSGDSWDSGGDWDSDW